jgi:sn1-specific diacylglycerol lipase
LEENLDPMLGSPFINTQPLDGLVNLSTHQPLYPPGKIIHIVRQHPDRSRSGSPLYRAVWADNKDFDQVLISKWMIQVRSIMEII